MFEDLKVVELASVLAGPLTGSYFAELGATVLKIENKLTNGDTTRNWKLPSEDESNSISAYYAAANYGKTSLQLDITNPADYNRLIDELKDADVVIQNFKPSAVQKLKVDYQTIKQINPAIIYATLSGYGVADNRPAFDVVLQAETGFMYMNGEPNGKPVKMPVALIDVLAAHHLKEAILCALIKRSKTGAGSEVNVSLYDSALASLVNQATNWLMAKHIPQAMGTLHPNIAPYGDMFQCADGKYLVLAVGTDAQFKSLANLIHIDVQGFETNKKRLLKREKLAHNIATKLRQETSKYWEEYLSKHNIPMGIVRNMKEVFETPEMDKKLLKEDIEGVPTTRVKTALM